MRLCWVIRSFLDYRLPVFERLDQLCGNQLTIIFPDTKPPQRVRRRLKELLQERAVELSGEIVFGGGGKSVGFANSNWVFPLQPGILRQIERAKPQCLIGDGFGQWTVPCILHRWKRGTPLTICYERTEHTERHAQPIRKLYRKLAMQQVDAICCNGSLSRAYLTQRGYSNERITTGFMVSDPRIGADNSIAIEREREEVRSELGVNGLVFLFVGRLIPLKGIREMLQAWSRFSAQVRDDVVLVIAGEGECREEVDLFCRQHSGQNNVKPIGPIDYARMRAYYAAADYLLMPTLEDNWSLVVPEAMSCKKPILCSKYNGCWPELVKNGVNGWVFDPLDPADFVRALATAYDHREQRQQMGNRSAEIAAEFTPDSAARAIYRACQIAMARRNLKSHAPLSLSPR